jgi:hypothetical protein
MWPGCRESGKSCRILVTKHLLKRPAWIREDNIKVDLSEKNCENGMEVHVTGSRSWANLINVVELSSLR